MMRIAAVLLLAIAATGCASQSANQPPEPNVVEIVSVPNHASVSLDCGAGTVVKGTTPLRVDVPKYPEVCTMEVGADDYRPLRMKFNRGLVLKQGVQLREDASHQLDQSASTFDMLLFPLQNLGDRIQNATMRKIRADYRLEVKLIPIAQ
ncbi:MAG: hypothetical protein QOE68_2970 [Thermoanaerobaculia bacterium]|jgi:hypothetical protein|nr:hypothetical protein [Thermoanaerobaculia bacterium]